jgi:hypothetical protein
LSFVRSAHLHLPVPHWYVTVISPMSDWRTNFRLAGWVWWGSCQATRQAVDRTPTAARPAAQGHEQLEQLRSLENPASSASPTDTSKLFLDVIVKHIRIQPNHSIPICVERVATQQRNQVDPCSPG